MRDDMAKLIVERPRLGGNRGRKGRQPTTLEKMDERPSKAGMKRAVKESGDWKQLNENLAPLYRFLRGTVGRRWDSVYSELRQFVKPGNTVQEHILTHVGDVMHEKVKIVPATPDCPTGVIDTGTRRWWTNRGLRAGELYVDPSDNIVKKARNKATPRVVKRAEKAERERLLIPKEVYGIKVDGIWYKLKLEPYSIERETDRVLVDGEFKSRVRTFFVFKNGRQERIVESLRGGTLNATDTHVLPAYEKWYGGRVLARGHRIQLSSAELKLYNLTNDRK